MSVYMNTVMERLYLGSLEAAADIDTLKKHGISHLLTVDIQPLSKETCDSFVTKYINVPDLPDSDLLSHFEVCNRFIDEGRQAGGILVHCFAGVSRSATLVMAYVMNKLNSPFSEVLSTVKTHRPCVNPNDGFKQQLILYEDMGCKINPVSNNYRQYRLLKLSRSIQAGEYQGQIPDDLLNIYADSQPNQISYKCRKCRQTLFKSGALLTHPTGVGESAFDWRGKSEESQKSETPCNKSLFIEPMKWMISYLNNIEGKIPCPKCSAKLGSFVWYGERCPCGTWVAPAFHIQSSKVDVCKITNIKPR